MKIAEKENNLNAEFGVVLEESASTLTQGGIGLYFEAHGRHWCK